MGFADFAKNVTGQGQEAPAPENTQKEFKEITLKFGKGCVGDTFTGKDGKDYTNILIPPADKADKSPWPTFVVRANAVHENQYGKGMWIKLPSEGSTTLHKSVVVGEKEDGKQKWETQKFKVTNKELKSMMEAYKERTSVKEQLSEKKAQVAQGEPGRKPIERNKNVAR